MDVCTSSSLCPQENARSQLHCADRLCRINKQNEETRVKHAAEVEQHNEATDQATAAHQTWQGIIWQVKANHSAECKQLTQAHDASCANLKAAWKSHKQLVDKDNAMAEATARRRHGEKVAAVKASNAEKREYHARAQTVRILCFTLFAACVM